MYWCQGLYIDPFIGVKDCIEILNVNDFMETLFFSVKDLLRKWPRRHVSQPAENYKKNLFA